MKNVRLFAVAAAMGMFATTVSAAAPTVTKDAYVATWGTVDEIIKVDVGDKVVLPTAEIKVVKESRTTDSNYNVTGTSFGGVTTSTCYVGETNEVGTDAIGYKDGLVDTKIYTMAKGAVADGWFHTNTKYFANAEEVLEAVSYAGSNIYGYRFLAPGSAKAENVLVNMKDGSALTSYEAQVSFLKGEGLFSVVDADADGNNDFFKYGEVTYSVDDEESDYDGKTIGSVWTAASISDEKNAELLLEEGLVNAFVSTGHEYEGAFAPVKGDAFTAEEQVYVTLSTGVAENIIPSYTIGGVTLDAATGVIAIVSQDRWGDYKLVATATDIAAEDSASKKAITKVAGKIKVVLEDDGEYSLWSTVTPKAQGAWETQKYYAWNEETAVFEAKTLVIPVEPEEVATKMATVNVGGADTTIKAYTGGISALTYLKTMSAPANTTDKIVINTYDLDLEVTGVNTTKSLMTITAPNGYEYTVDAVKLADDKWYPVVSTEAELQEFVTIFTGVHEPNATTTTDAQWAWADYEALLKDTANDGANPTYNTITYLDGTKDAKYIPANSRAHHTAQQCTYKVSEGAEVAATVTGNVDAIDTTEAGVKTLTLTAKVGEEVVGTKEIKVVVAPKYERVYKNGKVVKLTAKWLNGNTYAVYSYDWAAKTYTATFYQQDGVTVAATSNGTL